MGIIKDAIMQTLKEQGVQAEWVGEKPRVLRSAKQSKYDDLRKVEQNYTKGVHKARKEAGSDRTHFCGYAYADTPERLKQQQLETLADELSTKKTEIQKGVNDGSSSSK